MGSPKISEAVTLFNKWYEATKALYLVRRIQANYVLSQEKWDSEIPKAVIEQKGDINNEIQNSFIEEIRKCANECKVAQERDQELDKERILLSEKIMGRKLTRVELNQSASTPVDEQQTVSGKKGKVKAISISLGVVLLGLVLVEMGATILGYVIVLFGVAYGIKIILMK